MDKRFWLNSLSCITHLLLTCAAGVACTAMAQPDPATALRAKHAALGEQLRQNQFKRPLVLDSTEAQSRIKGDIFGVVDYPFELVNAALNNPDHWCDVMILHLNTKYCRAAMGPTGTTLKINIGKKTPEDLASVAQVEFNYSAAATSPEYLDIVLSAKDGPLGTSDYRIHLEAAALSSNKTFLHLTYAYSVNFGARLALQTYLGTIGSDKVGFTVTGKRADGETDYIGGVRGLVERNTMRYFLAIDAFLASARAAPAAQLEQRLQNWFTATEQYSRQLHEVDRSAYLEMKRAEYSRQQTER